jgi:hypothetical protein
MDAKDLVALWVVAEGIRLRAKLAGIRLDEPRDPQPQPRRDR